LLDDELAASDLETLREIAPRILSAYRDFPSAVYWEGLRLEIASVFGEQPTLRAKRLIEGLNLCVLLSV
jgi:hypothetical protein